MRSTWIIQVAPASCDRCPYKSYAEKRSTEEMAMKRWRQRLEFCSHKPRNKPPKAGKGKEGFSSKAFGYSRVPPAPSFWTLVFRTVRKLISVAVSNYNLLWQL